MAILDSSFVPNTNQIIIKPQDRILKISIAAPFLVAWFGGAALVGGKFYSQLIPGRDYPILIAIVSFWAIATITLCYSIIWTILGMELIEIVSGQLIIRLKLGPIALGKTRRFNIVNIKNMRIEKVERRMRGRIFVYTKLAFEYVGTTIESSVPISDERGKSLRSGPLRNLFVSNGP